MDIFGYTAERRMERRLIVEYEMVLEELARGLDGDSHALAVELAELPDQIRGYGHVKAGKVQAAKAREAELLAAWRDPSPRRDAAE